MPSDIGNLELPVSQLQQQNAQKKASDKLADKQKTFTDEQQRAMARRCDFRQNDELRKQRLQLEQNRSDSLDQRVRHSTNSRDRVQLARLKANPPRPPQPNPSTTPVPVTSDQARAATRLQQWSQQVAQLTAAMTQTEKGIDQIEASIDQLDESIKQVDKQQDAGRSASTADRRAAG